MIVRRFWCFLGPSWAESKRIFRIFNFNFEVLQGYVSVSRSIFTYLIYLLSTNWVLPWFEKLLVSIWLTGEFFLFICDISYAWVILNESWSLHMLSRNRFTASRCQRIWFVESEIRQFGRRFAVVATARRTWMWKPNVELIWKESSCEVASHSSTFLSLSFFLSLSHTLTLSFSRSPWKSESLRASVSVIVWWECASARWYDFMLLFALKEVFSVCEKVGMWVCMCVRVCGCMCACVRVCARVWVCVRESVWVGVRVCLGGMWEKALRWIKSSGIKGSSVLAHHLDYVSSHSTNEVLKWNNKSKSESFQNVSDS